jgi:type VI secretion system protein ImpK
LPRETLALIFQELLTTIVRLRAGIGAPLDARYFRRQLVEQLRSAAEKAHRQGFSEDDTRSASFAVVAFLDETILNLKPPTLSDWLRRPLQDEMFGHFVAGKVFFENLERLLHRTESNESVDLIELYALCILLGYQGKHAGRRSELKSLSKSSIEKVRRFRGPLPPLTPQGKVPEHADQPISTLDPWRKRLLWVAAACVGLALILFGLYRISLNSGLSDLRSLLVSSKA